MYSFSASETVSEGVFVVSVTHKRFLALFLAMVLCFGMFPAAVIAGGETDELPDEDFVEEAISGEELCEECGPEATGDILFGVTGSCEEGFELQAAYDYYLSLDAEESEHYLASLSEDDAAALLEFISAMEELAYPDTAVAEVPVYSDEEEPAYTGDISEESEADEDDIRAESGGADLLPDEEVIEADSEIPEELSGEEDSVSADLSMYGGAEYVSSGAALLAGGAPVAQGSCGDNLTWSLSSEYVLSITGRGPMYDKTSAPWDDYREEIVSLDIGQGVTYIGAYAFDGCKKLTEAVVPDGVINIGPAAFYGCSMLASVTIPDTVTRIGINAFYNCSKLENVSYLGLSAQWDSIEIDGGNDLLIAARESSKKEGRCGENVFWTFLDSGTLIFTGSGAIPDYTSAVHPEWNAYRGEIVEVVFGDGLTGIGKYAIYGCVNLHSVSIPAGVKSISELSFYGSGLESISVDPGNTVYSSEGNCLVRRSDGRLVLGFGDSDIPSYVKSIGEKAFERCSGLVAVEIPDNVTSIGRYAFRGCSSLRRISFGKGIKSIGEEAFSGCPSISTIAVSSRNTVFRGEGNCLILRASDELVLGCNDSEIPYGVRKIGTLAFSDCTDLRYAYIPESVTSIGDGAFYGCTALSYVEIPESVTSIGYNAFYECKMLQSITIPGGVAEIRDSTFYGCTGLRSAEIPGSVKTIGICAFLGCSGLTDVALRYGVGAIDDYAFSGCSALRSINIPGSVKSIGKEAFYGCGSLVNISIPGSVSDVGKGAFWKCSGLVSLTILSGVKTIGERAFSECSSLKNVIVPYGVTSIGRAAFSDCTELESVSVPHSVAAVGSLAFDGCCALQAVYYSGNSAQWNKIIIGDIDREALEPYLKIKDKTIECGTCGDDAQWTLYADGRLVVTGSGGVDDYDEMSVKAPWYDFRNRITSVIIDKGITRIGTCSFIGCSAMTSVTIPDGMTSIGSKAFQNCTALTGVDIPGSVSEISRGAFYNCSHMTDARLPAGLKKISDNAFELCGSLINLTLPAEVESIGHSAFAGCGSLGNVTVPAGAETIGPFAFHLCGKLQSIRIPESVDFIGDNAFLGCGELRTVFYGGNLEQWISLCPEIGYGGDNTRVVCESGDAEPYSSGKCGPNLRWSVSGTGILTISGTGDMDDYDYYSSVPWYDYALSKGISGLEIKSGVAGIGDNAFSCYGMCFENVSIPSGVKRIGHYAFYGSSLKSVTIPSTVKTIGNSAFYGSSLKSVTVPSSVEKIGAYAFSYCCDLYSAIIAPGITSIPEGMFSNCTSLTDLSLPSSVSDIMNDAFVNCGQLLNVYYSGSSDQWDCIDKGNNTALYFQPEIHFGSGKTYTVRFDPNGGTGDISLQMFVYGMSLQLNPNVFTRTGYKFTGWKYGDTAYKDCQTVKNLTSSNGAVVTMKAQWKPDINSGIYSYKIVFNGNGNTSGKMGDEAMKVGTSKSLTENAFSKIGYHFTGWAADPHGEVLYRNKQSVKDLNILLKDYSEDGEPGPEVSLYAVWEANTYTVTYNPNGGRLPSGKTTSFKQTLTWSDWDTLRNGEYVRTGYTFLGWSRSSKAAGASYSDRQTGQFNLTTKNKGSVTLYAVWKPNSYFVEFRPGSPYAAGTTGTQMISYGKSVALRANSFSYPGYSFSGWKCSNGRTYADKAAVQNLSKENNVFVTMTAVWKPNSYTVRFSPNGGKGASPEQLKGNGDTELTIPANTYTFSGCEFVEWNTKSDGSGISYEEDEEGIVFDTKNGAVVTLYAIWKYSAAFDFGTRDNEPFVLYVDDLYYNQSRRFDETGLGFVIDGKEGYYIAGWNRNAGEAKKGTVQYKASAVRNVGPGSKLYAVWKPRAYTIRFDANGGTGKMSSLTMTYNTSKPLTANAFKWSGHLFLGWSTDEEGPVEFTNKQAIINQLVPGKNKDTITLYAIWS